MQSLSKAMAGDACTVKWMFGVPELLRYLRANHIEEGSAIQVVQNCWGNRLWRQKESILQSVRTWQTGSRSEPENDAAVGCRKSNGCIFYSANTEINNLPSQWICSSRVLLCR